MTTSLNKPFSLLMDKGLLILTKFLNILELMFKLIISLLEAHKEVIVNFLVRTFLSVSANGCFVITICGVDV